jgi:hypothetical protein
MAEDTGNNERPIVAVRKDKSGIESTVKIVNRGGILGRGFEGTVQRVGVVSEKAPDRVVPLISKEFHGGESNVVPYDRIFENYALVKDAKLPVPHTFRAREDKKGILLSDSSEGGQNAVLTQGDDYEIKAQKLYAEKPDLMNRFAHEQSLQSQAVTEQTNELVRKATNAGLRLHSDTWFIVVKPDGTYDFVIGDFANVKKKEEIEEMRGKEISSEELFEMNRETLDEVRIRVGKVQKYGTDPQVFS